MKNTENKKLAVICSQFPEMHETFVIRELNALRQAGIPLVIYSMKICRDPIIHPESSALIDITRYAVWNDPRVLFMGLVMMLRYPVKAVSLLLWTLRYHSGSPIELIKGLIVWLQSAEMARRMIDEGVTHVHAHWATMPATAGYFVHKWLNIPFSVTAHAWDIFVKNKSLSYKIKKAKAVITCTDYNRRHLEKMAPDMKSKIHLNYHGVDTKKFSLSETDAGKDSSVNYASDKPLFISVGRLVEQKGFEDLLRAYEMMSKKGVLFNAVIIGGGPLFVKLSKKILEFNLAESVRVVPGISQAELKKYYRNAAAFVLPCVEAANGDRDGIPNVIFEAMAAGCPVVTTNISGIPEAVSDRQTGFVTAPRNSGLLAETLMNVLNHPQEARSVALKGQKFVTEKFHAAGHMKQLVELMKNIMGDDHAVSDFSAGREPDQPVTRKRILHIIWSLDLGGAEQMVANLVKALDVNRYEPVVCCLNTKGRYAEMLESKGVKVIELHKKPKIDFSIIKKLTSLIRNEKIDLVHTHLFTAHLWGRIAAWITGTPVISTEHGSDDWRNALDRALDCLLLPVTKKMIFVSQKVKSFYEKRLPNMNGKAQVIYNGIETKRFNNGGSSKLRSTLGIKDSARVIGIVGRLIPLKQHKIFIEAIGQVLRSEPNTIGLIVGEGPLDKELRSLTESKGIKDRIIFSGFAKDTAPYYRIMDAFVLCSDREGLPVTMLEAMASGVPVVATRVGGIPECLEHEKDGILIPPRDVSALTAALNRLMTDPILSEKLVRQAKAKVENRFSIEQTVREYEQVYEQVLQN